MEGGGVCHASGPGAPRADRPGRGAAAHRTVFRVPPVFPSLGLYKLIKNNKLINNNKLISAIITTIITFVYALVC